MASSSSWKDADARRFNASPPPAGSCCARRIYISPSVDHPTTHRTRVNCFLIALPLPRPQLHGTDRPEDDYSNQQESLSTRDLIHGHIYKYFSLGCFHSWDGVACCRWRRIERAIIWQFISCWLRAHDKCIHPSTESTSWTRVSQCSIPLCVGRDGRPSRASVMMESNLPSVHTRIQCWRLSRCSLFSPSYLPCPALPPSLPACLPPFLPSPYAFGSWSWARLMNHSRTELSDLVNLYQWRTELI